MAPIKAKEAVSAAEVQGTEDRGKAPHPAWVLARRAGGQYSGSAWALFPQEEDWALGFGWGGGGQGSHLGEHGGDWRPHLELAIHWFPMNVHYTLVLIDQGSDCSLIYRNPEHFPEAPVVIDGCGEGN